MIHAHSWLNHQRWLAPERWSYFCPRSDTKEAASVIWMWPTTTSDIGHYMERGKVAVSMKAPSPQRASLFFRHSWKLSIYSLVKQISLNTFCSRHYAAVNIIKNTAIFKIQYFFSSKFLQNFLQSSSERSCGKPHVKVTEAQSLYLKSCV